MFISPCFQAAQCFGNCFKFESVCLWPLCCFWRVEGLLQILCAVSAWFLPRMSVVPFLQGFSCVSAAVRDLERTHTSRLRIILGFLSSFLWKSWFITFLFFLCLPVESKRKHGSSVTACCYWKEAEVTSGLASRPIHAVRLGVWVRGIFFNV